MPTIFRTILPLAAAVLLLTGCGQEQPQEEAPGAVDRPAGEEEASPGNGAEEGASPENGAEEEESPENGDEEEESSQVSLPSILDRATETDSLAYDMNITYADGTDQSAHMKWKGENMRAEASVDLEGRRMNGVYILDTAEEEAIVYMPDHGQAMRMGYSQAKQETGESPEEQTSEIREADAEVVDEEELNGKECLVVEYTPEEGDTATAWIWKEHGLPIKVETETDRGTVVTEMENIEFADIPASEFELPEGVQVTDIPSGLMN